MGFNLVIRGRQAGREAIEAAAAAVTYMVQNPTRPVHDDLEESHFVYPRFRGAEFRQAEFSVTLLVNDGEDDGPVGGVVDVQSSAVEELRLVIRGKEDNRKVRYRDFGDVFEGDVGGGTGSFVLVAEDEGEAAGIVDAEFC